MAVYLIESINPDDVQVKKMSVDGIQNTIKYEIKCKISYEQSKKLSVESELADAVQGYSAVQDDISLTFKSISPDTVRLVAEVNDDHKITSSEFVNIIDEILSECEHLN